MNTICPFIDWFCIEKYCPTGFNRQKRPIHVMNHVMSFMVTHQCTLVLLFTIINSKHDYERKNLKSRSALQETNSCHFLSMFTHQCTLVFLFTIIKHNKHDSGRKNLNQGQFFKLISEKREWLPARLSQFFAHWVNCSRKAGLNFVFQCLIGWNTEKLI